MATDGKEAKEGNDCLSGGESDKEDRTFMKESLAQAEAWDAKGVSVDEKMLLGKRSQNRGFTVAMGKKEGSNPDDFPGGRRVTRANTLPSMGSRRGDYALSEETLAALKEKSDHMVQRFRRGSIAVTYDVIPEEELTRTWEAETTCFMTGKMTEGQVAADERERVFMVGTALPGPLPALVSCTKGCKGVRDVTPNQDNFSLVYFKNGYNLCCCMDGHGPFGHIVATRVAQTVPYFLIHSESFPGNIENAFIEAFENAQREVVAHSLENHWDVQASGSTAVAALWKGEKIWTANVGDSRCVIGYESTKRMAFETQDHKPNSPEEIARINANGGEVRSQLYPDGWMVHRIFVRGMDYPGLCMARTLGDDSVKAHGVIATPEVVMTEVDLSADPFLILASDGVWEFLDSEFVVKAVAKKIQADGPDRTIQKLQREARKRWRQEEGDYCDDITSVLIQLRA